MGRLLDAVYATLSSEEQQSVVVLHGVGLREEELQRDQVPASHCATRADCHLPHILIVLTTQYLFHVNKGYILFSLNS